MPTKRLPDPVYPSGMEIAFYYACPNCRKVIRVMSPTKAVLVTCPQCHQQFPIVPVDEADLNFFHIMTADGRAAMSGDYL
ncbi:MAG: hypothetical protein Q4F72_03065 [Desulfovibrionaceae bacterium]|nr:hypothetical protein [Desulfovibrionaceae bacterium]